MTNLNLILKRIETDSKSVETPITRKNFDFKVELEIIKKIATTFICKDFKMDKRTLEAVKLLVNYFNGHPDFEKKGYSLRKGILLAGPVGSGKSILMEIFKKYCFYKRIEPQFRIEQVDVIVDNYVQSGVPGLNLYTRNISERAYGNFVSKPIALCLDDLGIENEAVKHFGTEENVISKILFYRYELFKQNTLTHGTTNLSPTLLSDKYGERLYSRMREMFNFVPLTAKDRRK